MPPRTPKPIPGGGHLPGPELLGLEVGGPSPGAAACSHALACTLVAPRSSRVHVGRACSHSCFVGGMLPVSAPGWHPTSLDGLGALFVSGGGAGERALADEGESPPVITRPHRRPGAPAGGPGSRGATPGDTCQKAGPQVSQAAPFSRTAGGMQGASGHARVVFGACSKGPAPERGLMPTFLPGVGASVNFLLLLFGSKRQVSAGARRLWAR